MQKVETTNASQLEGFIQGLGKPLVHRVYEDLQQFGSFYTNKRNWCAQAIECGNCDTVESAISWILEHQAGLSSMDVVDELAAAPGEASPIQLERTASFNTAERAWQNMIDLKLFDQLQNGDNNLEEIAAMIAEGADLASTHIMNRTPLHMAVRAGQPKAVRLLLECRANPSPEANSQDGSSDGWTPLHNAINSHGTSGTGTQGKRQGGGDMTDIVYLLIEAKADLSLKIYAPGRTPEKYWMGYTPLDGANEHQKYDLADIIKLYM